MKPISSRSTATTDIAAVTRVAFVIKGGNVYER